MTPRIFNTHFVNVQIRINWIIDSFARKWELTISKPFHEVKCVSINESLLINSALSQRLSEMIIVQILVFVWQPEFYTCIQRILLQNSPGNDRKDQSIFKPFLLSIKNGTALLWSEFLTIIAPQAPLLHLFWDESERNPHPPPPSLTPSDHYPLQFCHFLVAEIQLQLKCFHFQID